MKRITHGARCTIKMPSSTADVAALRHDLRNGPRHYFGLHDKCNSAFCKQISKESTGKNYVVRCSKLSLLLTNHRTITSLQTAS